MTSEKNNFAQFFETQNIQLILHVFAQRSVVFYSMKFYVLDCNVEQYISYELLHKKIPRVKINIRLIALVTLQSIAGNI